MSYEMTNGKIDLNKAFTRETLVSSDGYTMPYRLYIPKNYDCGEIYPVLIFLHGAGERGDDNELNLAVAIPNVFTDPESPARRAIVIVPQCPKDKQWVYTPFELGSYSVAATVESRECEAVLEILDKVSASYNVDSSRIYITGISMGGYGTWDMTARHSELFAAAMPICGAGDPSCAKIIATVPIRTFHGSLDTAVPPSGSREMYEAVRKAGGRIKYTEFEGMGHGIWDDVYSDIDNVRWLFSQVKKSRSSKSGAKKNVKKAGLFGVAAGVATAVAISVIKKNKK